MNNNKNAHGGLRAGAGRKLNSGIYGEATKVIRVPESKVVDIQKHYNTFGRSDITAHTVL